MGRESGAESGSWRVKRFRARWLIGFRGRAGGFVHEADVVLARRRWADQALDGIDGARGYSRIEVPGTDLILFIPPPSVAGVLEFTPDHVARMEREDDEL